MSKPQSEAGPVNVEWRDHVAIVTVAAGSQKSTNIVQKALISTLQALNDTSSRCRAIVLTTAGSTFCAGELEQEDDSSHALDLFKLLSVGKRPVIAAVEGLVAGPDLSIVVACDFVVATPQTEFSFALSPSGRLPEGGLYWSLARRIGAGRARQAILSGRLIRGEQALEIGLSNELAAPGETLEKATSVAARYAAMPPLAMAYLKAVMATGSDTLDQAIETETNVQPLLRKTEDHKEAVQAFLQKRAPNFFGR